MKAAVIIFPGSNREHDVCMAWKRASGHEPARIWHRDAELPETDLIILPGNFVTLPAHAAKRRLAKRFQPPAADGVVGAIFAQRIDIVIWVVFDVVLVRRRHHAEQVSTGLGIRIAPMRAGAAPCRAQCVPLIETVASPGAGEPSMKANSPAATPRIARRAEQRHLIMGIRLRRSQ